jgi:hypothetical protein
MLAIGQIKRMHNGYFGRVISLDGMDWACPQLWLEIHGHASGDLTEDGAEWFVGESDLDPEVYATFPPSRLNLELF